MGYCITSTPEMGEYSVEARRESFYLRGEDVYDYVYNGAPMPLHVIHFQPDFIPSKDDDNRASSDDLMMWFTLLRDSPGSPAALAAKQKVEDELKRARRAEAEYRSRLVKAGTIEILTEDIPKIRACLDIIERYESGEKGL